MKRNKGFSPILIVIIIAVLGIFAFFLVKQQYSINRPSLSTTPTSTPTSTKTNEPQITTPALNTKVASPLVVKGKVPSGWMFEGQFPISLLDSNRKEIATSSGKEITPGSWTGEAPVDFEGTITFTTSAKSGFLVVGADNPSGLPENNKSFEVPVKF